VQKPDINRILEFQKLLLQFQAIERIVHVPGNFRLENDTEHSYNLAMTAWFLAEYFPHLDRDKVIRCALAHDLVEIHAGDTYAFGDQATLDSKHKREAAALKQLEKEWSDFPGMLETIREYERRKTEEAKFVYALDKIMPIMVIYLAEGHTWREEGIGHTRLHEAKRDKISTSQEINEYYDQLTELLVQNAHYFPKV